LFTIQPESKQNEGKLPDYPDQHFADYPGHVGGAQSIRLQEEKSLKMTIPLTLHHRLVLQLHCIT